MVYKTIQATIGMESLLPYAVASTTAFLLSVVLVYVYVRRRVGDWLALAGLLPILFLGAASTICSFRSRSSTSERWRPGWARCS